MGGSNNHSPIVLRQDTLNSDFAEGYRELRANIGFTRIDEQVKSIVVTSASPGEGKTTTVLNLGIVMAQAGLAVAVVDADLRQPGAHWALYSAHGWRTPGALAPGLANVITGATSIHDVTLRTPIDRLFIIPAGPPPPNPSELLAAPGVATVLEQLAERVDCVLIDTPPCTVYSDALLLSRMVDGVLYVVRAGSQKAAQRRALKQLQQAKARLLGVVLNDADSDEMGRNYGHANGSRPASLLRWTEWIEERQRSRAQAGPLRARAERD